MVRLLVRWPLVVDAFQHDPAEALIRGQSACHPVVPRLRRRDLASPPPRAAPGQDAADQPEWRGEHSSQSADDAATPAHCIPLCLVGSVATSYRFVQAGASVHAWHSISASAIMPKAAGGAPTPGLCRHRSLAPLQRCRTRPPSRLLDGAAPGQTEVPDRAAMEGTCDHREAVPADSGLNRCGAAWTAFT